MKKGFLMHWAYASWRGTTRHVAAPQKLIDTDPSGATWMPTWRDGFIRLSVWATSIVGPLKWIGGCTRPVGATQRVITLLHFIPTNSTLLSPCGSMCFFFLCRRRGASWSLWSHARNEAHWSSGFRSTWSWSYTSGYFATVDLIYEIRQSRFNRTLGKSWSDTWPRKNAPMNIKRRKSRTT